MNDKYKVLIAEAMEAGKNEGMLEKALERGLIQKKYYEAGFVLDNLCAYIPTINGKKLKDASSEEIEELYNKCKEMDIAPDSFRVFENCIVLNWFGATEPNYIKIDTVNQFEELVRGFSIYLDGLEGIKAYMSCRFLI